MVMIHPRDTLAKGLELVAEGSLEAGEEAETIVLQLVADTSTCIEVETPEGVEFEVVTIGNTEAKNLIVDALVAIGEVGLTIASCLNETTNVVTIESAAEVVATLENGIPTIHLEVLPGVNDHCSTRNVNGPLGSYRELCAKVNRTYCDGECIGFESANLCVRNGYSRYKRENQKCKFFHFQIGFLC